MKIEVEMKTMNKYSCSTWWQNYDMEEEDSQTASQTALNLSRKIWPHAETYQARAARPGASAIKVEQALSMIQEEQEE